MIDYKGIECPVCDKKFGETDDVVVCPICGAPYHRECYAEKGSCINNDLHEKDEKWKAPTKNEDVSKFTYEIKDQECLSCGVLNAHSATFCASCGAEISSHNKTHLNDEHKNPYNQANSNYSQPMPQVNAFGMGASPFDPMGGVAPLDKIADDITAGELSKVVQQNTRYYLPIFKKINEKNKSKFNFYAFIFSGAWLLYRKQYKLGIITTVFMFLMLLAQTFVTLFVSAPILVTLLDKIGVDPSSAPFSAEEITSLSLVINPQDFFALSLPTIIYAVMLLVMLLVGFNANRIYMKHCTKTVYELRKSTENSADYNVQIMEKGGINTSAVISVIICYILCNYLPYYFM